jgi:raffinose/stachyose/melibiose transport system permease protein
MQSSTTRKKRPYLWFMAPGMLFYTVFMILPLIFTLFLSVTSWNGVNASTMLFVGLKNFKELFTNPLNAATYWNAFGNNIKFIILEYVIIIPIQLIVAYLFCRKIRWYKFFQGIFFMPYVFSTAVIAFFSTIFFNANFGIVNKFLLILGVSKINLPAWYADPKMCFGLMLGTGIWYSACIGMLILLANMKNISMDVMEAATVDGANEWRKFRSIILPDMGPGMINIIVLDAIWGITLFDLPYMLAGTYGGVGGVLDFVNMYFYRYAFGSGAMSHILVDYGFAAAISAATFIFMVVMTLVLRWLLSNVKVWNE